MFGRNKSGLDDDIANLQDEASDVLRAIEKIDRKIYEGINGYQLENGSHVKNPGLEKLNTDQRKRVLRNFVGRFYEREVTHLQFKVVLDSKNSELAVVSEEMSPKHICIPRPE